MKYYSSGNQIALLSLSLLLLFVCLATFLDIYCRAGGSQPLSHRPVPVHSLLGPSLCSRRWAAIEGVKLHLPLFIAHITACTIPCPWRDCLSWNRSLVWLGGWGPLLKSMYSLSHVLLKSLLISVPGQLMTEQRALSMLRAVKSPLYCCRCSVYIGAYRKCCQTSGNL